MIWFVFVVMLLVTFVTGSLTGVFAFLYMDTRSFDPEYRDNLPIILLVAGAILHTAFMICTCYVAAPLF